MATAGNSQPYASTAAQRAVFLILALIAGLCLWQGEPAARAAVPAPEVSDTRTCASLAVYEAAAPDDWSLQAAIARTHLNSFISGSAAPECGKGVAAALSGDFDPVRWQRSLDVVDAVQTGDYLMFPDACALATEVVPPTSIQSPDAQARAQCVIRGYAFVGGDS